MEEREVLSLMLSLSVLVFILVQWPKVTRIPSYRILVAAFVILLLSWLSSVVEDLLWKREINRLQHLFSGLGAVVLAAWCRGVCLRRRGTATR